MSLSSAGSILRAAVPVVAPNWNDPIAQGLRFLYSGATHMDLVYRSGGRRFLTGYRGTPLGLGVGLNGDAGRPWTPADSARLDFTGEFSLWCVVYVALVNSGITNYDAVFGRWSYTNETNNQGWNLNKTPHSHGADGTPRMSFRLHNNNGAAVYDLKDTTNALAEGQVLHYVGVRDSTTRRLYRDGVQRVTSSNITIAPNNSAGLKCGSDSANNKIYAVLAAAWNRALDPNEVVELYKAPFRLFRQPSHKTYFLPPAQTISGAGGIASAEAVGSPSLGLTISGVGGIASAESVGSPVLGLTLSGVGAIASGESVGSPTLTFTISGVGGIPSAEAVASPSLGLTISGVGGIASGEAVGQPTLSFPTGVQTISDVGAIPSAEAVGKPTLIFSIGGVSAEEVVKDLFLVPGGLLGTGGMIRLFVGVRRTVGAGSFSVLVRYGGQNVLSFPAHAAVEKMAEGWIAANGSELVQRTFGSILPQGAVSVGDTNVDSREDQSLQVIAVKTVPGDDFEANFFVAERLFVETL